MGGAVGAGSADRAVGAGGAGGAGWTVGDDWAGCPLSSGSLVKVGAVLCYSMEV